MFKAFYEYHVTCFLVLGWFKKASKHPGPIKKITEMEKILQRFFHPNVDRLEVTKKCRINTSMPAAACLENLVKHTLPDYIAVKYNLLSKSMELG